MQQAGIRSRRLPCRTSHLHAACRGWREAWRAVLLADFQKRHPDLNPHGTFRKSRRSSTMSTPPASASRISARNSSRVVAVTLVHMYERSAGSLCDVEATSGCASEVMPAAAVAVRHCRRWPVATGVPCGWGCCAHGALQGGGAWRCWLQHGAAFTNGRGRRWAGTGARALAAARPSRADANAISPLRGAPGVEKAGGLSSGAGCSRPFVKVKGAHGVATKAHKRFACRCMG